MTIMIGGMICMRRADFDVAWDGCRKRSTSLFLDELIVDAGRVSSVRLVSRVAAFVGVNGAGKTGLMRKIFSCLAGENVISRASVKEIKGIYRGKEFFASNEAPANIPVELLQSSSDVADILRVFRRANDLEDVVAQYEERLMPSDPLGLFRSVAGVGYESVGVTELERSALADGHDEDDVIPYFKVKARGITYDSREMGLGELCAFYVIWRLMRAQKNSVVLLDEPDSHLSPRSRAALIDAIGFIANERSLVVLLTTHSVEMLEQLRREDSFLVSESRVPGMPTLDLISNMREARLRLNLRTERTLLIVVEDVDALAVVSGIINKWASGVSGFVDVAVVKGGEGAVRGFCSSFPDNRICKVVAVLDGDKRIVNAVNANDSDYSAGEAYLPTNFDPVHSIRISIGADVQRFSARLGYDSDRVEAALMNTMHCDHHDFISSFISSLGLVNVRVADMRHSMVSHWLDDPLVMEDAEKLATWIAGKVP